MLKYFDIGLRNDEQDSACTVETARQIRAGQAQSQVAQALDTLKAALVATGYGTSGSQAPAR